MTPDQLATINDLRSRALRAKELILLGDEAGALSIEPSLDEIKQALNAIRANRYVSATKATASATAKRMTSIDVNALFQ